MSKISVTTRNSDPQLMSWDTEFFGIRVGRATHLDGLGEWAVENTIGLVCLLADTMAEVQEAEERGFRLMDVRTTLTRDTATLPSNVRLARADDTAALRDIARSAFTLTRFYADPRLADYRCGDLYSEWTRALCAGGASVVLVAERSGHPVGYVTVDLLDDDESPRGQTSEIGLIAVSSGLRGGGIGAGLVRSALDWARSQGAYEMSVVTQGLNVGALRTFEGQGFRITRTQFWLHRWMEGYNT